MDNDKVINICIPILITIQDKEKNIDKKFYLDDLQDIYEEKMSLSLYEHCLLLQSLLSMQIQQANSYFMKMKEDVFLNKVSVKEFKLRA